MLGGFSGGGERSGGSLAPRAGGEPQVAVGIDLTKIASSDTAATGDDDSTIFREMAVGVCGETADFDPFEDLMTDIKATNITRH